MTKSEIYEHLANVYLGKSVIAEKKTKRASRQKIFWNIVLSVAISLSTFAGLTAFLVKKNQYGKSNILFAFTHSPIRVKYDLTAPYPKIKNFSITIPEIDVTKYSKLNFSIRGLEEGYPGIVKIVIKNKKKETATYFVKNIKRQWERFEIPLSEFEEITDWTDLETLSFVLEEWNIEKKKGIILIDDISFSG